MSVIVYFAIIQRHPEGIATLSFKEFEAADECVLRMNGRWYAGQQLEVNPWDGITNYQVEETDQERESRLSAWEKFLEEGEESKGETQQQPVSSEIITIYIAGNFGEQHRNGHSVLVELNTRHACTCVPTHVSMEFRIR